MEYLCSTIPGYIILGSIYRNMKLHSSLGSMTFSRQHRLEKDSSMVTQFHKGNFYRKIHERD